MERRKRFLNKRGQSMVEIALITPLLLAALYVVMDFGVMFFTAQYTQNAVREAARIGSIMPDCAVDASVGCVGSIVQACPGSTTGLGTIVKAACDRLPNLLTGKQVTVTLTGSYSSPIGCMRQVRVTASGTYTFGLYRVMALMGVSVPPTTTLTRAADTRYQGQPVYVSGAC